MSPIHADDLPPAVRKKLGLEGKAKRSKPSRAGISTREPSPGKCGCGAEFDTAAAWEKHCDAEGVGHGRYDLDLEGL